MSADKEPAAVKLPFSAGEYLCTWVVPGSGDSRLEIPGMLTVETGKYPWGVLYGKMPIEWTLSGESRMAAFPQRRSFDTLTGRLSTGAYVALMNGELAYWFETQGRATGAFAVLSQEEFSDDEHRKYTSIEVQIEGLEAVTGVAPIARTKSPTGKAADPTWAATVNDEANLKWEAGAHEMSFWYNGSFRSFDAYEFRMVFGPVLRLTSATPLTAVDWWLEWIRPLRQLISLMTTAPRDVRYVLASNGVEPRSHRDQLFGWDITQEPVNSTRAAVEDIPSSVNLRADGVSLLDLLMKWQELAAVRHPLIETYGTMATTKDQHPRSRFLLLLQALEGLHGFENKAKFERKVDGHSTARAETLERAKELLAPEDYKFIDAYLMKFPPQGLQDALIAIFKSLPVDIVPELEKCELVAQVRSENSDQGMRVETALQKARNSLSHGTSAFAPDALDEVAQILDRVVRAEGLRVLGAPVAAQERALKKPER